MTEPTPTSLTFEAGYERLQSIAARLNQEDVPVSEMCDLFEQGKDLEQALTTYLDKQKARVEAIQNGEGTRKFTITGGQPATQTQLQPTPASEPATGGSGPSVDTADFVPSTLSSGVADDDIPF